MSIANFKEYALSLSPVVFVAPINGNHNTIDSFGRAVSEVGTTVWRPNSRGWGIDPNNAGYVCVADDTEQQITTFTIFLATTQFSYDTGVIQRLISKNNAGTMFEIYRTAANTIAIDDNSNVRTAAIDISAKSTIAISVVSTATPKLYADGLFASNFSGISTIVPQALALCIGARSTNTEHMQSPILAAAMFPAELTAQQISILHSSFNRIIVGRGRTETPYWPVKKNIAGPLVHLDFTPIQGNKLRDLSGNDLHFENENVILEQDAPIGASMTTIIDTDTVRRSTYNSDPDLDNLDPISLTFWCRIDNTYIGGMRLFSKVFIETYMLHLGGGSYALYFTCSRAGGTAGWYYTLGILSNYSKGWVHFTIAYDRSNAATDPILYINNVATAWTVSTQQTGAFNSDAAIDFYISNYPTLRKDFMGSMSDFQIYDKILTPTEVEEIYLEGALKPHKYVNKQDLQTTLTNLSAGARMGPYNCITAGHSVDEDSDGRRYLQMPIGNVVLHSKFAYGSFYMNLLNRGDINIGFIQSINDIWSATGNYGYVVRLQSGVNFRFYKLVNGARSFLEAAGTCTDGVNYEIFISRNSSNSRFYLWVRGGIYSVWTFIFSIADATYKISNAISLSSTIAGTKIYDIAHFQGFLEPNDVPGLIDG